ncbi:MAG: protein kinase, partial [Lachnospiraceae bacterium]|nr:protein kinase [Lachnospiraceae bacterium]
MREKLKRGAVLKGRYTIREIIGSGGFSNVYSAWDQLLFRKVAIKELTDTTWREDFLREAAIMEKLSNIPSIRQLQDSFSENGTEYMVMNLINGSSLFDYVQEKGGALPVSEVLPMMEKILFALEQIHSLG